MKTIFRPLEFWQSAVMTLPDAAFFDLLRSVFGKIKTPFNKQKLLENLTAFLQRDAIQKNIAAYIDSDDAKIIAAVAALDEPAAGVLESFFSGELSYAKLNDLVINLEERFILYRFWEKGAGHLALNPVLESVIAPFAAGAALLFPSTPAGENSSETSPAVFDDRVFAGIISFAAEEKTLFKAEGGLRKKTADLGGAVFSGIDLEAITGACAVLGIFRTEEDALVPDIERVYEFAALETRERMEYLAAGIYCYAKHQLPPHEISPYLFRLQVRELGAFIHRLSLSLAVERVYPQKTIKRIAEIIGRDFLAETDTDNALVITSMEKAGLFLRHSPEHFILSPAAGAGQNRRYAKPADSGQPFIAMDTAFSCVVYPETDCADLIDLALAFNVREAGTAVRFELTRDSAIRAFNRGFSAQKIIDLLNRLSGGRTDKNMAWTLNDWEKRYGEVSLFKGLVLCLESERRYLAETDSIAPLIIKTLADGVYLLDESAETEAAEALKKAGVDIIAARAPEKQNAAAVKKSAGNAFARTTHGTFTPLGKYAGGELFPAFASAAKDCSAPAAGLPAASGLIDGFHSILEKTRCTKEEREELAARIDRRLVLCEAQLKDAAVRYEKLEARGLDYAGKAIIAKQAIAMKSPVELLLAQTRGADRITGLPLSLEKSGGESVLVIKTLENNDSADLDAQKEMRIPLGKISLLRRIKKSIFEH